MAMHFDQMPLAWSPNSRLRVERDVDDGFSPGYRRWLDRAKRRALESIFGRERLEGSLVLDVGSGGGFFVDWYLGRGAKVEGLDESAMRVERLGDRFPDARFTRRSIGARAFAPLGTFHIINVWDALRRTADEAFERALTNIAGCCDEGSLLIAADRLGAAEDGRADDDTRFRSLRTYDQVLSNLGFESVRTLPLYHQLNRRGPDVPTWHAHAAPLLYALDRFARTPSHHNLSVGVWRYAVSKEATIEPGEMWAVAS